MLIVWSCSNNTKRQDLRPKVLTVYNTPYWRATAKHMSALKQTTRGAYLRKWKEKVSTSPWWECCDDFCVSDRDDSSSARALLVCFGNANIQVVVTVPFVCPALTIYSPITAF